MSIESDLRKDGIEVIKKIDTLKTNSIARTVSIRLCKTFPSLHLNQHELFVKLSRLNMYIAKIPRGMADANYFYKNSSIYFSHNISEDKLDDLAIHECIHYLQEVKDKKNHLLRMGLCDYTEFKIYGLGLNEAAVQLMTSKVLGSKSDFVKYFNIEFETASPLYYPLECCLVNQLSYISGESLLLNSTFNSNNDFKEYLCKYIGYKNFATIQNSIDTIIDLEEQIIKLNNKIINVNDRNKKVDNFIDKINQIKLSISDTFFSTQNLIITSYFDNLFKLINNDSDIEFFRKKLYNFKDFLGSTENYTFFNDYYVDKMMALENKSFNSFSTESINSLCPIPKKNNKIRTFLNFIKRLLLLKFQSEEFLDEDI